MSDKWEYLPLAKVAKIEWGNTSITKKSYVPNGFTAFSASGPDGFLDEPEWSGPAVILSAIGAKCGKCFYANGHWTAIKNTIVIQGDERKISHKLLFYYLNDASKWYISGSGQPFITLRTARETVVPVPPPDIQIQIVAEIEKQFSRLDETVSALKRIQANLKRYKAAVLKAAVEGKLTEQWRKEHPDVEPADQLLKRILAERRARWEESVGAKQGVSASPGFENGANKGEAGKSFASPLPQMKAKGIKSKDDSWKKKYKEPAGPDTANLPELPEGWVWASVEQLGDVFGGLTKNPKRASLPLQLPYLRVANVYANELRLDEIEHIGIEDRELVKLLVQTGDLLIVEGNGSPEQIGRVAIWDGSIEPCVHQNHLIKVRLSPSCLPKWTLFWLLSANGRNYIREVSSSTSGLYTLSVGKVGGLPVPLPSITEQQQVDDEIDRRLSITEELETTIETSLKRAERLRQTILQQAFSGGGPS